MNIYTLGKKAETMGIYNVESLDGRRLYLYNDGEYGICTFNGLLRIPESKIKVMIDELTDIVKDIEDLRRMGIKH